MARVNCRIAQVNCVLVMQQKLKSCQLVEVFISFLYNNMCTYDAISSHTDHFEMQKRDSEESLLTFVNLFPSYSIEIQ